MGYSTLPLYYGVYHSTEETMVGEGGTIISFAYEGQDIDDGLYEESNQDAIRSRFDLPEWLIGDECMEGTYFVSLDYTLADIEAEMSRVGISHNPEIDEFLENEG